MMHTCHAIRSWLEKFRSVSVPLTSEEREDCDMICMSVMLGERGGEDDEYRATLKHRERARLVTDDWLPEKL